MKRQEQSRREYVLRALAATEIADTCNEPRLRDSFFALAEEWLERAEHVEDTGAQSACVH